MRVDTAHWVSALRGLLGWEGRGGAFLSRGHPGRGAPVSARSGQPPIADIGAVGCRKPGSSMPWPGSLREQRARQQLGDFGVVAPARSGAAQVGLLAGEQAVADLTVGGEPHPVAGTAERPGHRGDDADRGRAAVDQPRLRGRAAALGRVRRGEREGSASRPRISSAVTMFGALPAVLGVERHLLDEPQLVAVVEAPAQQVGDASSSLTPRISTALTLTGVEPGVGGGREPVEHVVEPVAAGQRLERLRVDRVEARR